MNFPDPRITGGLLRPIAPALDFAGVETVSGPEPARARAGRVLWAIAVSAELLALRVYLPPHASRGLIDSLLVSVGITAALSVLSAVPWLRWLEGRRPRPSVELNVRIAIWFAAIQLFIICSLLLRDTPPNRWIFVGSLVALFVMAILPPWVADRWPPAVPSKPRTLTTS